MSMMTLEKLREYADAVSRCSSPENVSRFNQAAGQWLYANIDNIDAHLRREVKVPEDAYGESVDQIITKALCELSNAREDVESGKPATAILSFLREAEAYMEAAREAMLAAAPTSVATDGQGGEG